MSGSMPTVLIWFRKNTMYVKLSGLHDTDSQAWVNDATVKITLYDSDGNAVENAIDVQCMYVPNSNGDYKGSTPVTVKPAAGDGYEININVAAGGSENNIRIPVIMER